MVMNYVVTITIISNAAPNDHVEDIDTNDSMVVNPLKPAKRCGLQQHFRMKLLLSL